MPDKDLVIKKLSEVLKQLKSIKELSKLSERALITDESKLYLAERVMERLIGAAIDINMHLASDIKKSVPEDYYSSFIFLAKMRLMPMSLAKKLAPSAGRRNILVHEYQELDIKKFKAALKKALADYTRYVQYIQRAL